MTTDKPYNRSHFEALLPAMHRDDMRVDDAGVWPAFDHATALNAGLLGEYAVLGWKPILVFADDRPAPDSKAIPGLPFPFDARQLAAFLLDGVGSFIADFYGGLEDGIDEESVNEIDVGDARAREAVREAFNSYREARTALGCPYGEWPDTNAMVRQLLTPKPELGKQEIAADRANHGLISTAEQVGASEQAEKMMAAPGRRATLEQLTCWGSIRHRGFTGLEAALAMVGKPNTEDPEALCNAAPVLDLMRRSYEGTRSWLYTQGEKHVLADSPAEADPEPVGLLVSEEMQAAQGRTSPQLVAAGLGDAHFLLWLRRPCADFDQQTFSRDVLARWVQEVEATSLYAFTKQAQAVQVAPQAPQAAPLVAQSASVTHTTTARRDAITPVLELAQRDCNNPKDTAEVWARLLVLAERQHPPLRGATESGLQYLKDGDVAYFTRDHLGKRLRPPDKKRHRKAPLHTARHREQCAFEEYANTPKPS